MVRFNKNLVPKNVELLEFPLQKNFDLFIYSPNFAVNTLSLPEHQVKTKTVVQTGISSERTNNAPVAIHDQLSGVHYASLAVVRRPGAGPGGAAP